MPFSGSLTLAVILRLLQIDVGSNMTLAAEIS